MLIRHATPEDIPQIIFILKQSLGESKLPKTEEVWRYKHIENPFGKSIVLLAIIKEQIVGVRAFMRWKWQIGQKSFNALRAVDTATSPAFRGRGIFRKLTLEAIEIAKAEGEHF